MICQERTERQKDQDYVERTRHENLEKANRTMKITDEMVEAGCLAAVAVSGFNPSYWPDTYPDAEQLRKVVRAVLETATYAGTQPCCDPLCPTGECG